MITQIANVESSADDCSYQSLKRMVIERTGLSYYENRDADLLRKLQARMVERCIPDLTSYLDVLLNERAAEQEFDELIVELTIGETYFFRHQELFDAVREIVLPNVIERNRLSRRIRVWSAGCSIGAETYSMSILIRECLGDRADDWDVAILGTDINRDYLARARQGRFEEWALRSLSEPARQRYFEECEGQWQLAPEFLRNVSFQYHNLVKHPFPSLVQNLVAVDIVLCRNVLIYFDDQTIRQVASGFHGTLSADGWLLVGHSEPRSDLFPKFQGTIVNGAVLYQKHKVEKSSAQPPFPLLRPPATPEFQLPLFLEGVASSAVCPDATGKQDGETSTPDPWAELGLEDALVEIRLLADNGQLQSATQLCTTLLDANPLHPGVNFYFALLLEQRGELAKAERCLRGVLYLDRNYALAHYYLGLTQLRLGNGKGARRSFANVLSATAALPADQRFNEAEDMTVDELRQLSEMQLSTLETP
jgi:chemotaxis protein methyltransferase CheR